MFTFLLNLMTIYLYSGAASAKATLIERRDCINGGGGTTAATFTQLQTANYRLLLCAARGGNYLLIVFNMLNYILNGFYLAFKIYNNFF